MEVYMSHYWYCMLPHELEELAILRKCMLDFLLELCRSDYGELCLRMGAKQFTEAFPTWQYSIRKFRARINTTIVQTAGDGPTQSNSAMHNAILARLKNIAEV